MRPAQDQLQEKADHVVKLNQQSSVSDCCNELILAILKAYTAVRRKLMMSNVNVSLKIKAQLQNPEYLESKQLLEIIDHLLDKSIWALGGDGWAYDIGWWLGSRNCQR